MKRLALLLIPLACAAQAGDYLTYKMVSTAAQPFPVYVDSRSNNPAGITYLAMQNAVERAWATWSAVQCAYPKVRSLGASAGNVPNAISTVDAYSVTPIWMLNNDADALSVFGPSTLIAAITLPRAYAGVLQTCDVYFNGFNSQWSADAVTPTGRMDIETVMLHEAGHCLGLDHFGPADAVMDQSVSPGESVRVLTPSDITHLCDRDPLAGASGSPCLTDGGCLATADKCLLQPVTNGVVLSLCTKGCGLGTNAQCDVPLYCQASSSFSGFNGACLMPGSIITAVGKACTVDSECASSFGTCRHPEPATGNNFFWIDGYCTQQCRAGDPACPAGSACVQLDTGPQCAQSCRVGLADCRAGYACAQIDTIGTSGVCIPRCYADQDCADPVRTTCRACDGLCVNRQNIAGQIGDVCADDSSCGAGQLCRITDAMHVLKQCTQQCSRGCGLCPSGSTCTPGARGELFCLRDCTGPGTCPVGLRCADTTVGKSCQPACQFETDCPVGQGCYLGECYIPTQDAGCGTLCTRPDAGPVVVIPKDGGNGGGGTGGCGCATVDPVTGLAALVALGWLGRRRSWRLFR